MSLALEEFNTLKLQKDYKFTCPFIEEGGKLPLGYSYWTNGEWVFIYHRVTDKITEILRLNIKTSEFTKEEMEFK